MTPASLMALRGAARLLRRAGTAPTLRGAAAVVTPGGTRALGALPLREPAPGPPPVGEVGPPSYGSYEADAAAVAAAAAAVKGPWNWPRMEVSPRSGGGERERDPQGRPLAPRVGA